MGHGRPLPSSRRRDKRMGMAAPLYYTADSGPRATRRRQSLRGRVRRAAGDALAAPVAPGGGPPAERGSGAVPSGSSRRFRPRVPGRHLLGSGRAGAAGCLCRGARGGPDPHLEPNADAPARRRGASALLGQGRPFPRAACATAKQACRSRVVDGDERSIEVWRPGDEFPAVSREWVTWLPAGAAEPRWSASRNCFGRCSGDERCRRVTLSPGATRVTYKRPTRSGRRTLRATARSWRRSRARYTVAMPPCPSSRSTAKRVPTACWT